jgi:hypothetical protein
LDGCLNKNIKNPKGYSSSPWSLHIGSFWKIHLINPSEAQRSGCQVIIKKDSEKPIFSIERKSTPS